MQVKWLIIPKITSQISSVFSQNWILHKSNLVLSVKVENHKRRIYTMDPVLKK